MSFHRASGNDLFIWGNALFYSPDGGHTILLVTVFASSSITLTHFTSSSDGSFAFITSDNIEYFGNLGTQAITRMTKSRVPSSSYSIRPYFDTSNALHELTLSLSSNTLSTSDVIIDTESILEYYQLSIATAASFCPYSSITVFAPNIPANIRTTNNNNFAIAYQTLPSSIYLDYQSSYSFIVRLFPAAASAASDVKLGFRLSGNDAVRVNYTARGIVDSGDVEYGVEVVDLGMQMQGLSGQNLTPTVLRVLAGDGAANFGCKDLVGRYWKSVVSRQITIFSGCPPYQEIEFIWKTSTTATQSCPNPDLDMPCLFYPDSFSLEFAIFDQLTEMYTTYNGTYSLLIIASGPSPTEMTNFTADQIQQFNPSMSSSTNSLIWSDSITATINPSPSIYFTFHVTTYALSSSIPSYCVLTKDFTVRVYGLPVSFENSIAVTLGCMFLFVACVVAGIWIESCVLERGVEQRWRFGKIFPVSDDDDGGDSNETLLGGGVAQSSYGSKNYSEVSVDKESQQQQRQGEPVKVKTRLHGYDGPVKGSKATNVIIGGKARPYGDGMFGFLRNRTTAKKVHNEEVDTGTQDTGQKLPGAVATAIGDFKRTSTIGSEAAKKKPALADIKREKLMEEYLQRSTDLVEALRDVQKRKEKKKGGGGGDKRVGGTGDKE
ncbi:hypothetical protein HK100_005073 [Physocladia obscura]|uniref:CATSPERG C-terminal domain-containing protein n=1 Tax=Physocladia obscura TaxID=109957 RepID=A0AAD5SUD4_9FUNG|nr:hypothetical protein HK100_005073 [Physocladia obscura]